MSEQPQKIYSDLIKLRHSIGGLQAKKAAGGPMFPIKNAKELMIKLRAGLDELNMTSWVSDIDVGDIPMAPDKSGKVGSGCLVKSKVVVASDDGSFVVFTGVGHGFDRDDKAAGKASTYAWKDALIKGLNLPDAEMKDTDDESDIPVTPKANPAAGQVAALLAEVNAAATLAQVEALAQRAKDLKIPRADAQPLVRAFAEARARVA